MISVYLQMFCIPQVENGTQRWAANQTDSEQEKRSRRAGASSVAVRQPPSDLNQKLRSLSPSLGRYHELRRDRGRWVEYVREAGGINGANFQERYRGGKRGQPPESWKSVASRSGDDADTVCERFTADGLLGTICPSSCWVELWRTWFTSGLLSNKVRWVHVCFL